MKKGIIWLLVGMMLCALVGCGSTTPAESTVSVSEEVAKSPAESGEQSIEATPQPTEAPTPEPTEEPILYYDEHDPLWQAAEQYGFKVGGAFGYASMGDVAYLNLLTHHFNSVTATNEMKAYSLLDQKASAKSENGMPVMNYTNADKMVQFAADNGLVVRGHVLVWDAYMSDWFFREDYSWGGEYVDRETMKARLQYYIEEVITHFESEFPGVVTCWDVVNEAVADGDSDCNPEDVRRIRKLRGGTENQFYNIIGEDYVELSFLYAKDTVEKLKESNPDVEIKLFYNDYNTFYDQKRDAIIRLVESINSYAQDNAGNNRKLCDGVGMQSYIGGYGQQSGCMNISDLARIETAINMYADLGIEVHVTEMAVRNYSDLDTDVEKHAEFYGKLFEIYKNANADGVKRVTSVSIWGLCDNPYMSKDDYSYKMNGPYCGLFTENYEVKGAFKEVYRVLTE